MKTNISLAAATIFLFLSSCSPRNELDATNSDTFRESLNRIAADMTEQDRQTFGQDILVIARHADSGVEGLGNRDLYDRDYSILFASDDEFGILSAFATGSFEKIVLDSGTELHGKTPGALNALANRIRSEYYAAFTERVRTATSELESMLAEVPARIAAHEQQQNEILDRIETLRTQRETAVQLTLNSFIRNPGGYLAEGTIDLTNHHNAPITGVTFNLSLTFPDFPGNSFSSRVTVRDLDGSLSPGDTLRNVPFASSSGLLYRENDGVERIPQEAFDRGINTSTPEVTFRSYSTQGISTITMTPMPIERLTVDNLSNQIDGCKQVEAEIQQAISENNSLLSRITQLVDNPAPFDGLVPRAPSMRTC